MKRIIAATFIILSLSNFAEEANCRLGFIDFNIDRDLFYKQASSSSSIQSFKDLFRKSKPKVLKGIIIPDAKWSYFDTGLYYIGSIKTDSGVSKVFLSNNLLRLELPTNYFSVSDIEFLLELFPEAIIADRFHFTSIKLRLSSFQNKNDFDVSLRSLMSTIF